MKKYKRVLGWAIMSNILPAISVVLWVLDEKNRGAIKIWQAYLLGLGMDAVLIAVMAILLFSINLTES